MSHCVIDGLIFPVLRGLGERWWTIEKGSWSAFEPSSEGDGFELTTRCHEVQVPTCRVEMGGTYTECMAYLQRRREAVLARLIDEAKAEARAGLSLASDAEIAAVRRVVHKYGGRVSDIVARELIEAVLSAQAKKGKHDAQAPTAG